MQDALISPSVALTCFSLSVGGLAYASSRAKRTFPMEKVPLMGVMGAFVFAAQMINFPVLLGSSGHLIGAVLLAILLGPHTAALTMAGIVTVQCLIFQDGGLLALGANLLNMALLAVYSGHFVYRRLLGETETPVSATRLFLASFAGSATGVFVASLALPIEIGLSNVAQAPLETLFWLIGSIHIAIALAEGMISATILLLFARHYPDFFSLPLESEAKVSRTTVLAAVLFFAFFSASVLSLVASELPDGLEWAIQKWSGHVPSHSWAKASESLQEKLALFPDYNLAGKEAKFWTAVAGAVGSGISLIVAFVVGMFVGKRKDEHGTFPS